MMIECDAYEEIRKGFMSDIIGIIGSGSWDRVINRDDYWLSTILGFESMLTNNSSMMEEVKVFLGRVWGLREQLLLQLNHEVNQCRYILCVNHFFPTSQS